MVAAEVAQLRRPLWSGPALVGPYLRALITAGALVLLAAFVGIARDLASFRALTPMHWALLAGLSATSYLVLSNMIMFRWRGLRVALGPDEVLVFLALFALPAPAVVLFAVPPMAIYQIVTKRDALRAGANVAVVTLAAGACVSAFAALSLILVPIPAILGAIVVYTFTTHLLVSSVFALREDTLVHVVFGERFWVPTLLHIALGTSGGLAIVALWSYHPAALSALVPFVWLAKEHVTLVSEREREEIVHKRLAANTRALVGERDLDRVAARVLDTCSELFQAGRASLVVNEAGKERRWSRDFEGGWKTGAHPLATSLRENDGSVLGALMVHPSAAKNGAYGETDERLLQIVAGEAGAAIANARALRDLDAARARLETLLATATDAVLLVGTDGLVRFANPAGRSLLGLREGSQAPARDIFEDLSFLSQALRGGERKLHETWARSPTHRLPVEVSAARLRDDPSLVLLVVRDATDRKAGERALLSQRVAQPLVRRIVRGLMVETRADSLILMRLGGELAAGIEAREPEGFTRAYGEMGLGALTLTSHEGDRHEFDGKDLLERTQNARSTTCYLALGFLCGAVSRLHEGKPARGAEVECCSRGDARCRFVVTLRPDEK